MLIEQMNMIFEQWKQQGEITEKEIYGFLHRIKGTAGTIGLKNLSNTASELIEDLSQEGVKLWRQEEWEFYLCSLIDELKAEQLQLSKVDHSPAVQGMEGDILLPESSEEEAVTETFSNKSGNSIILLINKNIEFSSNLKEELEGFGYVVLIALTMEKGMDLFYRTRPSFIICEYEMALEIGERELVSFISASRKSITPIVLTGNGAGNEYLVEAYNLGAGNYFQVPVDIELLTAYLQNRLLWREVIHKITTIDELTGAFNRKYMNSIISQLVENYHAHGRIFSVAVMDLDHFKQVNDQYGHLTGDEVLKRVVAICRALTRQNDEIFRFGGEEFVIVFPDTNQDEAYQIMERMRKAFEKEIYQDQEQKFNCTFSAGVYSPSSPDETKDSLLDRADRALYQSKARGRNQVTIYSEATKESEQRRLHMIIIDDDKFVRTILKKGFSTWEKHAHFEIKVHTYADGEKFLNSNWYQPQDQYLILLDGMMPKMDGIEVLTNIRANYPDKNIVVSMLSARSDEENIILALEEGADDYLFKPFNVVEVIARMDRLAQRMLL